MTDETEASALADMICGCANREQHRRDVKLIEDYVAARITALDKHRIERAGDVETKFAEHIKWLTEPLEYAEDRDVADNMREAASLIASLRAENARARQEGWNAAIEAAASAVAGYAYPSAQVRALAMPDPVRDTLADSDGDDGA